MDLRESHRSKAGLISSGGGGSGHPDWLIFMRNVKDCIIRTPLLSAPPCSPLVFNFGSSLCKSEDKLQLLLMQNL